MGVAAAAPACGAACPPRRPGPKWTLAGPAGQLIPSGYGHASSTRLRCAGLIPPDRPALCTPCLPCPPRLVLSHRPWPRHGRHHGRATDAVRRQQV